MSLYQASPAMLVEENNNTLAEASRERPAGRKGGLQHSMSQLSVTSAVDLGVHQLDSDNRPFQDRSEPSLEISRDLCTQPFASSCSLKMESAAFPELRRKVVQYAPAGESSV